MQSGYCFVVSQEMLEGAKKNVAMQQSLGIVNEWSEGPGFPQHLPEINPDGIAGIVYEPHGGYADPVQATEAYVGAFKKLGGEFRARTPVRRLLREGDRITGVELDSGEVERQLRGECRRPVGEAACRKRRARPAAALRARAGHGVAGAGGPRGAEDLDLDGRRRDCYYRPLGQDRFIIGRGFPKDYFDVDPYNYKTSADDGFHQRRADPRRAPLPGIRRHEADRGLCGAL